VGTPQVASVYSALASHYAAISARRRTYLEAVEDFVIRSTPRGVASLLDVGAGDGVRARRIGAACDVAHSVLLEPDPEMARICRGIEGVEVWETPVECLADVNRRFELVTCLWNVLGHVPGTAARIDALRSMSRLLAPGGRLFFDVNNRYNAAAYGWPMTLARVVKDVVRPADSNGDITFHWVVDGVSIPGRGHVFTPAEIDRLAAAAGLRIRQRVVLDYESGRRRRSIFSGQLLYEATAEGARSAKPNVG
jgi:SAM-dependent methyltransferase